MDALTAMKQALEALNITAISCKQQREAIANLHATINKVDALTNDAERYRWLREQKASDGGYWVAHGRVNGGLSQWHGESLDAAIDALMLGDEFPSYGMNSNE